MTVINPTTRAAFGNVFDILGSGTVLPVGSLGRVRTSLGAFTVLLPTDANDGDAVGVEDASGNAPTNPITIGGNGNTIDGSASATLDIADGAAAFVWREATSEWERAIPPIQLDDKPFPYYPVRDLPAPAATGIAFEQDGAPVASGVTTVNVVTPSTVTDAGGGTVDLSSALPFLQDGVAVGSFTSVDVLAPLTATDAGGGRVSITDPTPAPSVGWTTALNLDFTAEATQDLSADGTYTIGGVQFKRENAAQDLVGMILTNGVGLVITPTTSDYTTSTRSAPLLWLALNQLGITDLDWTTRFRVWLAGSDTYNVGFETSSYSFVGIDSDNLLWSPGWVESGLPASATRIIGAGVRLNSAGTLSTNSPGAFPAQAFGVLRGDIDEIGGGVQSCRAVYGNAASPWPAPAAAGFRPLQSTTTLNSGVALRTIVDAGNVGPADGLGVVLGAAAGNAFVGYIATLTNLRVDYHL